MLKGELFFTSINESNLLTTAHFAALCTIGLMYEGFFVHSPFLAHDGHFAAFLSTHAVYKNKKKFILNVTLRLYITLKVFRLYQLQETTHSTSFNLYYLRSKIVLSQKMSCFSL